MFIQRIRGWARRIWEDAGPTGKKVTAAIAAAAMAGGLVALAPSAHATDTMVADPTTFTQWEDGVGNPVDPRSTGRVWTDKSVSTKSVTLTTYDGKTVTVSPDKDDEFLVGLSALSSAQQLTGRITKPLDVVLVLDTSGSMAYGIDGSSNPPDGSSRMDALKTAVNGFIDRIATANDAIPADRADDLNRIGLVTYATRASQLSSYTSNFPSLKRTVDDLRASGATRADLGMNQALTLTQGSAQRDDATSVVIFFTDGVPTKRSTFDNDVAKDAVTASATMKADGTSVYSVGIFNGANPTASVENVTNSSNETTKANAFMQAVSSNYPNATSFVSSGLGVRAPNSDYYLAASDADALNKVFETIWEQVSSRPTSPIESETTSGTTTGGNGAVVFTDQLGDYMTVRDFKSVIFAGNEYTDPTISKGADGTDTYTFHGTFTANDVYGDADLSTLNVSVKHNPAPQGDTVKVSVPAELLPLRLYSAKVDADGTVTTDIKRTNPIRVFYTVALQDGVDELLAEPDETMRTYLADNTDENGNATFLTNRYNGGSNGDTTAVFTPAQTNDFYYVTQDTPLYNSRDVNDPVTAGINADTTYWYQRVYYADNARHEQWLEAPGKNLVGNVAEDSNGHWYAVKGMPRLGLANYTVDKTDNLTDTASTSRAPNWASGSVRVELGNNGRVTTPVPSTLRVEKHVDWGNGTANPDREFNLKLELGDVDDATYSAQRYDSNGNKDGEPLEVRNGSTFTLKDGQYVLVNGLPQVTYEVSEDTTGMDGWKEPTLTDASGTLEAGRTTVARVDNAYSASSAILAADTIHGTKTLQGRDWESGRTFEFAIAAGAETPDAPLPSPATVTLNNNGTIHQEDVPVPFSFGQITYDKPGTYRYVVTEKPGNAPSMAYSSARFNVTVTVTDNGQGALEASATITRILDDNGNSVDGSPEVERMDFTNTFTGENQAAVTINGIKNYDDHTGSNPNDHSGKFKVLVENLTPDNVGLLTKDLPLGVEDLPVEVPVAINGEWSQSLSFDQAALANPNFKFRVTEVLPEGVDADHPTKDGMTYDTSSYEVDVTVSRDADGNLVAQASYPDNADRVTLSNSYEAAPTDPVSVEVAKSVDGRAAEDGQFDLDLRLSSGNTAGVRTRAADGTLSAWKDATAKVPEIAAGASAPVNFDQLVFTLPGTYEFKVTEQLPDGVSASSPTKEGWTYDTHTYTVTFTVTDENGQLKVADHVSSGESTFANTYRASGSYGTDGTFKLGKTMTGRDLRANEFSFRITPVDGAPMPGGGSDPLTVTNPYNAVDGNELVWPSNTPLLADLTFTQADADKDYTYHVSEVLPEGVPADNPTKDGITYDPAEYNVTIHVTDDGKGTISTTTTVEGKPAGDTVAHFSNAYAIADTTVASPTFGKVIDGRDWNDTDAFTFTVAPAQTGSTVDEAALRAAMPKNTEVTVTSEDLERGNRTATFAFGEFTFTRSGTYVYEVRESGGSAAGVTNDKRVATLSFTVTDNGRGAYAVGVSVSGIDQEGNRPVFTNTYEAKDFEGVPEGFALTKTLEGRDWTANDSFDFTIKGQEGAPMPQESTVTVDKPEQGNTATFDFGSITYDEPGEYVYEVHESKGSIGGVEYDEHVAKIKVTVTDDGRGQLKATAEVTDGAFTNRYGTTDYEGVPDGFALTKTLTGTTWTDSMGFDFTVTPLDGAPAPADTSRTVTRPMDGGDTESFNFGAIRYTKPGTYTYEVRETKGELGGMTYDDHVATVTVTVTDNGEGKLEAKAEVTDGAFLNTYRATAAEDVPTGFSFSKRVDGMDWSDDLAFDFTLEALDGAPAPANSTMRVTKPDEGNVATFDFGKIRFDKPGTYRYQVTETAGAMTGMDYDSHAAIATVTVKDTGAGHLAAAATVENGLFVNSYETAAMAYPGLTSTEDITGRSQSEGEFSVSISGSADDMARAGYASARSAGDTQATFGFAAASSGETVAVTGLLSGLTLTHDDVRADRVFSYHVQQEGPASGNGLTVDTTTYDVRVWATDNGDGTMRAHTSVNGQEVNELPAVVPFHNSYVATPIIVGGDAAVHIGAVKTLDGRAQSAGEFSFAVRDSQGNELATGTNAADGSIAFSPIEFTTERLLADAASGVAVAASGQDGATEYRYQLTVAERTDALPEGVQPVAAGSAVTVVITDDARGTLSAQVVYPEGDSLSFINRYGSETPVRIALNGNKVLKVDSGNNPPDIAGKYSFTISGSEGAPMPSVTTVTNDAAGAVDFGEIELNMNIFGDEAAEVNDESAATESAQADGDESADAEKSSGEVADGDVTGDESVANEADESAANGSEESAADEAAADVADEDAANESTDGDAGENQTVQNQPRERTFTYTVTESGAVSGVTNDAGTHVITVRVVDDGYGNLSVVKSTDGAAAMGMDFTFTNSYAVTPVGPTSPSDPSAQGGVSMTKTLSGRDLKDGEFSFEMIAADGSGTVVSTGVNAADGTVTLPGVTFNEPGEYPYVIREVQGDAGGVTYDDAVYGAVARVVDNGDGTLGVSWRVTDATDAPVQAMTFTNGYKAAPTSVEVTAAKSLVGRTLKAGEFSFQLRAVDEGAPMPQGAADGVATGSNDEVGAVHFGAIDYTEQGEWHYEVSEVVGNEDGMRYDQTTHPFTVRVTDGGDGQLTAAVEYAHGIMGIMFTNVYVVPVTPSDDPTNPDTPNGPTNPTNPDKPTSTTGTTNTSTTTASASSMTLQRIASTGSSVALVVALALVLACAGVSLLVIRRRRD